MEALLILGQLAYGMHHYHKTPIEEPSQTTVFDEGLDEIDWTKVGNFRTESSENNVEWIIITQNQTQGDDMDVLNFIKDYQKILITRVDDISLSITSGGVTDWEDYKARVGEIQGVTYALDEMKALLKKVKYIDDTDRT